MNHEKCTHSALTLAILCTIVTVNVAANEVEKADVIKDKGWQLVWSDEFSEEQLDESKWTIEENCWGGGNDEAQCYTNKHNNLSVADGMLRITARQEPYIGAALPQDHPNYNAEQQTEKPYTSARINTKNKGDWRYGRIEVKAKLPAGQGTWPAIWMLPTDNKYGSWAASGEIDIVEAVNLKAQSEAGNNRQESRVHGTLHYGQSWPNNVYSGTAYTPEDNPADDFHLYAIEWERDEIRWYVDDMHYATQKSSGWYTQFKSDGDKWQTGSEDAPFNERFHLIINLAVGGSWAANVNEKGIDEGAFPAELLVDSVSVYQCRKDRKSGQGCQSVDQNAKLVKGHQPRSTKSDAGASYEGPSIEIFDGQLAGEFAFGTYQHQGSSAYQLVQQQGENVIEVSRKGSDGNFYISLPAKADLSHFEDLGNIVFDLRVISAADSTKLLVKIDSGWPAVSDKEVEIPANGEWQNYRIPVKEILANGNSLVPGNKAEIKSVSNLLVIEPTNEIVYQIKNIRWENQPLH